MSCQITSVFFHFLKNSRNNHTWRTSQHLAATSRRFQTTTAINTEEIRIPKRISRSPTDILEALASTIKRDPTAPHFKFHDDPALTPTSNNMKRSFALAQEAGRSAAKWIKQEHSELFLHRNADPFIQAFAPLDKLTETTPMTEDLLNRFIQSSQVQNAIQVYEKLDISTISLQTKQSLLELLCFYNAKDPIDEDLLEERWFKAGVNYGKEQQRKTWIDNGIAEKVFNSFNPKTSESYCALICGMVSHGHAEGAWQHFNQMLSSGLQPNLDTYNSMLRIAGVVKESADLKVQYIQETLTNMLTAGIKPNVRSLNAILESVNTMPIDRVVRGNALQYLADFKSIGVKPCLSTYFWVLKIFYRKNAGISSTILADIVHHLEEEIPTIQDVQDVNFFPKAMEVCNYKMEDAALARRLFDLVNKNPALIGDSVKESIFYRHFISLLCRTETPESVMEVYHYIVPSIYTPEQSIFEDIVNLMQQCSTLQYLPELWNDALYMELSEKESILETLLSALSSGTGPSASKPVADPSDIDPILTTAKGIWSHVEEIISAAKEQDRSPRVRWSGSMLGNLMKVFLQYGDMKAAIQVMHKISAIKNELRTVVSANTLNLFLNKCIECKETPTALMTIDYASLVGYVDEASSMAQLVRDKLTLDERQQMKLQSIVSGGGASS